MLRSANGILWMEGIESSKFGNQVNEAYQGRRLRIMRKNKDKNSMEVIFGQQEKTMESEGTLLDPSLEEGNFKEMYGVERDMVIRMGEGQELKDQIMIRLFRGEDCYKIELTSEANISFFYTIRIAHLNFQSIMHENRLRIAFQEFSPWLRQVLRSIDLKFTLRIKSKEHIQLIAYRQDQFQNYDLLKINFALQTEQKLRQSLMFRYERMKQRFDMLSLYLQSMEAIIKTKNPSLLLEPKPSKKQKHRID